MEKVSINTSQNVQISYALASLGDRILAHLLDSLIMVSITIVLLFSLALLGIADTSPFLMILAVVPAFFYHLILEITQNGQSIGKKVMKIKVVKLNGTQATFAAYLLRWLIWPVDTFFYGAVAILCITFGGKGQRLGDMAGGTAVIKLQISGFLKDHTLNDIDDSYTPIFSNADLLSPEYIELIKKAIKAKLEFLDNKPVIAIAAKTKAKLDISTDLPDLKFLHTIIKDYHHIKLNE